MMLKITVCPVCGGKVNKIRENWIGEYQGQKYIVPDLEYYECEDCGERIYHRDAMRKIEACSSAFERSMEKAGLIKTALMFKYQAKRCKHPSIVGCYRTTNKNLLGWFSILPHLNPIARDGVNLLI